MSGLFAILHKDGQNVADSDLRRVSQSLRSYGPERQVIKAMGRVGFAYAHLTNTPEARSEAQPITGTDSRFTLVFDGRFDNRSDVARELGIEANRLVSLSDAQLAMLSWEKWGDKSPTHWVGEFALIIWDSADQRLIALRDQFGSRTLHYSDTPSRIVIASAPKCIHALGDLPREIDEQKIADTLCQLYHDGERTFFKGINRVPAAGILTADRNGFQLHRYYRLRDAVRPVRYKTDAEYVEAGLEKLDTSVQAMLRTSGPVGAFLSGGLDSSSMSAVAAPHLAKRGKNLISFTSVPESDWDQRDTKGLFGNEAPYVQEIGAMIPNIEINLVDGKGLGHYHKQEDILLHLEMPVRNALNLQWTHAILEKAKARGVAVMLQGTYGNATLTHLGDGVFGELLKSGALRQLYRELSAVSRTRRQFVHRTFRHLVFPLSPHWVWDAKERLRGRCKNSQAWERSSLIVPAFAKEMDIAARAEEAGYGDDDGKPSYSRPEWYNIFENWITETGDIMQGLRAIYGIEIRDPFANRHLIEWSFGVPETQYHRMGVNRWLIRRMMADKLPPSVVDNKRFGQQTADWHVRLSRDLPQIKSDIKRWRDDPDISRMVDLDRLSHLVESWPEHTLTDRNDPRYQQLQIVLPMVMQTARFVQREKGRN